MSLRDQILAANDLGTKSVEVPEWEVTLEIRTMTAAQRNRVINNSQTDGKMDPDRFYQMLLTSTLFDPSTGEPVFTPEDAEALMGKNYAIIERLAKESMALSGMGDNDVDDEGKSS